MCFHRGKPNLLDMGSLLIKPVQRIMKYPLLLRELWQATPDDHIDYLPLQEALTAAKIINVNINEFRRRKDIGVLLFTSKTLNILSVFPINVCFAFIPCRHELNFIFPTNISYEVQEDRKRWRHTERQTTQNKYPFPPEERRPVCRISQDSYRSGTTGNNKLFLLYSFQTRKQSCDWS